MIIKLRAHKWDPMLICSDWQPLGFANSDDDNSRDDNMGASLITVSRPFFFFVRQTSIIKYIIFVARKQTFDKKVCHFTLEDDHNYHLR